MGHKTLHRKQMIRTPTPPPKNEKEEEKKKRLLSCLQYNHKAMEMSCSPYFVISVYNCFLYEGFS